MALIPRLLGLTSNLTESAPRTGDRTLTTRPTPGAVLKGQSSMPLVPGPNQQVSSANPTPDVIEMLSEAGLTILTPKARMMLYP